MTMPSMLPDFDPTSVPAEAIPAVLSVLAAWQAQLSARLLAAVRPAAEPEALLNVEQAAAKLSVTEDWLYRRGKKLGLAVKLGDGTLRFSNTSLDQYIRERSIHPVQGRRRKPRLDKDDSIIS